MNKNKVLKIIIVYFIVFIFFFIFFLYIFDRAVFPSVIAEANIEMKQKTNEIICNSALEEFSGNYKYDDLINIEKDSQGNITMLRADTLKLNKIACDIAIDSQKKIKEYTSSGIVIPSGYIFKNNFLASIGPDIKVKMYPIGQTVVKYNSTFESAGINQTRHKITLEVVSNVRIMFPLRYEDISVSSEVPLTETVIIGKIPDTALQMDLGNSGYKLKNGQ